MQIDLNSDVGEAFGPFSFGQDEALLKLISSANVACGFHAGDPSVMRMTLQRAKQQQLTIGAHPGFFDLRGFGRFPTALPASRIKDDVLYQLGALAAMAKVEGVKLSYVKPHGALYNQMAVDKELALAVGEAVRDFDASLAMLVLANSTAATELGKLGITVKQEGFIDRAYLPSGYLQPRSQAGSLIQDVEHVAERAVAMVCDGVVQAIDGSNITVNVDSLCIHGDTPNAVRIAQTVRQRLVKEQIEIRPFTVS